MSAQDRDSLASTGAWSQQKEAHSPWETNSISIVFNNIQSHSTYGS